MSIPPAVIRPSHLLKAVTCLLEVDRNALLATPVTLKVIGGFPDEEDEE